MAEEEKKILQWHPAFYAGIQIEFEEESYKLKFENEHQLGTKPKETGNCLGGIIKCVKH